MSTKAEIVKKRTEELLANRRKRDPLTLSRMGAMRLNKYAETDLDTENYHYCYVNEEKNNIFIKEQEGYEFVEPSEIKGYNNYASTGETSERVREFAGKDEDGNKLYTYLMKIPRDVFDYDQREAANIRKSRMEGLLTNMDAGALPNPDNNSVGDTSGVYSIEGNTTTKVEPLSSQIVTKKRSQV